MNITEIAANLAHAWKGTDKMHSTSQVRAALWATGEFTSDSDVDAVQSAIIPLLKRDGTLAPSSLA